MYKFYNANAVNRYTDDCVIRAISCAENKSWDNVYDQLSNIAQYEGTLFDNGEFVRNYLDRTYRRLPGRYGTVGETAGQFPNNTILITIVLNILIFVMTFFFLSFVCVAFLFILLL